MWLVLRVRVRVFHPTYSSNCMSASWIVVRQIADRMPTAASSGHTAQASRKLMFRAATEQHVHVYTPEYVFSFCHATICIKVKIVPIMMLRPFLLGMLVLN